MRNVGRKIGLTILIVFVLPVAVRATLWSFEPPRRWLDARWSSAGILPAAASDPAPRVVVFAARTAGWRSIFAVHTWIVVKPADAEAYTRYEVTGFGAEPIRVNRLAADAYWLGYQARDGCRHSRAARRNGDAEDRGCDPQLSLRGVWLLPHVAGPQ